MRTTIRNIGQILHIAIAGFIRHDDLTRAAALAFYTVLSLSPLLVIALNVVARIYAPAQAQYFGQIAELAGPAAASVMDDVLLNAKQYAWQGLSAGVISAIVLILGATALFSNLHKTMNQIWEVHAAKKIGIANWFRTRAISLLMILIAGGLILLILLLQTLLVFVGTYFELRSAFLHPILLSLFFILLFALIYRIVPDTFVSWRAALYGGIITTVLFIFGRYLIGIYLSAAWIGAAFGAAGGLFLLLLWSYYSAIALLFGVELTCALSTKANFSVTKKNLATGSISSGDPIG